MFNDGKYWERAKAGEFTQVVKRSGTPRPDANQPAGTLSQVVIYLDADGFEIARVHQYLRPDGTLGASGRPDPKRLFRDGVIYRLPKKDALPGDARD
jgi:hypothetical protein